MNRFYDFKLQTRDCNLLNRKIHKVSNRRALDEYRDDYIRFREYQVNWSSDELNTSEDQEPGIIINGIWYPIWVLLD